MVNYAEKSIFKKLIKLSTTLKKIRFLIEDLVAGKLELNLLLLLKIVDVG
jgi:hypothetical protein